MKIDFKERIILTDDNKEIYLTKIQNDILKILIINKGKVVKIDDLIKEVYKIKPDEGLKKTLKKHISLLKKKIKDYIKIKNIKGIGYLIDDIENKIKRDLQYIKEDIIAKRIDGDYCRFSKILNAISTESISYEKYLEYWEKKYKKNNEWLSIIMETCKEKLTNNLIDKEVFI